MKTKLVLGGLLALSIASHAQLLTGLNGLNNPNPTNVELGGLLNKNTEIDLGGNNMLFNKKGRFAIGESVAAANLSSPFTLLSGNNAKSIFDNGDFEETQRIYAYTPNGYAYPYVYGLSVQASNTLANTSTSGAYGIKSEVNSEGSNVGIQSRALSSNSNLAGNNYGVYSYAQGGLQTFGGWFEAGQTLTNVSNTSTAVWGAVGKSIAGYTGKGVQGISLNGVHSYGGYFQSEQTNPGPAYIKNIGIYADASNGPAINMAVHGHAMGGLFSNCTNAIGVYGYARSSQVVIGVKGECPPNGSGIDGTVTNLAGQFIGDVMVTGIGYNATYGIIFSDQRIKTNVRPVVNALDIIYQLKPKTYNLTNEYCRQLRFENLKTQYGLIAQEVEKVMPEIVYTTVVPSEVDSLGKVVHEKKELKGVSYEQLISVLIKGMQEQGKQMEEQKRLIDELNQKISEGTGINTLDPTATNFQMSQNEPNPFSHETTVRYVLPSTVSNAFMAVYDLTGKQITTFPIHEMGSASIVLSSEKLPAGIYLYSIVADGKVMDSKRMIVADK